MKKIVFLAISLFCMQTVLTFTPAQDDPYETKIGNFVDERDLIPKIVKGTVAAVAICLAGTGLKAMVGKKSILLDALEAAGYAGFCTGALLMAGIVSVCYVEWTICEIRSGD
ncbi:MAG TPA: hypothetical protein VEK38_02835 [Candidatus Bathyarchaeia archaeon]|nr:hypothetical protein [Candidatus Bathyarchaeia archaeon]